ncbi:MAG: DUF4349 domain-containing protein [Ruminococcaceae bacterium]|nr:DUF4349 domain-containing protein [Oscillospiraceae bacterium]
MRKILTLLTVIALCISLFACAPGHGDYDASEGPSSSQNTIVNNPLNRKIIYTVYLDLEAKDVSSLKNDINEKSDALGGYIENSNEEYSDGDCSYVRITYRVPTEKLDEFVNAIEGYGKLIDKSVSTTDITTAYVDAVAEKTALEQRKTLLSEMLNSSTISASDRMNVINEISKVDAEIQSIELLIKNYDSDVNYSTIIVTIEESVSFMDVFPVLAVFMLTPAITLAIVFGSIGIAKKRRNRAK